MSSRVLASVLALMGIVGLFAPAAQAGGAGGTAPLSAFFVCQAINGANVNATVNTFEITGAPGLGRVLDANVRVGSGVLFCHQVDVTNASTGEHLTPPPFVTDVMKCYSMKAVGSAAGDSVTLVDAFFPAQLGGGGGETVKITAPPTVLCAPALPRE